MPLQFDIDVLAPEDRQQPVRSPARPLLDAERQRTFFAARQTNQPSENSAKSSGVAAASCPASDSSARRSFIRVISRHRF